MAQVQRPPSLPTSHFLGHPEQRAGAAPSLPPMRMERPPFAPQRYDGPQLPPLQLPSIQTSPPASISHSSTRMGISNLLSAQPGSPTSPRVTPHSLSIAQPVARSPPRAAGAPRYEPYPDHRGHAPPMLPPLSQAPVAPHYAQQPTQGDRLTYPHTRPQPSTQSTEPEHQQYSPAVTCRSSAPSLYDSASEQSPRTSIAPGHAIGRPQVSKPPPLNYILSIRQQPAAARACGFGERDRRVIDPPPILELKITDKATGAPDQDYNAMLALHCTLLSPDCRDDETEVPPAHPDMPSTRRLMGTLVASPYQAKDEHGVAGTFFVFPDLSCRSPGRYRLRFKLLRVDPTNMLPGAVHSSVANITTDVFSVHTAKDFPGMRASSALLKSLRRQGLNVGVKKGSDARKGKGKTKKESSSSDEDDYSASDEEEEERRGSRGSGSTEGVSPKTKARKKAKRKRRDS